VAAFLPLCLLVAVAGAPDPFTLSRSLDPAQRSEAAAALAAIGTHDAIDRVTALLRSDGDPAVRVAAVRAFAATGNPHHQALLQAAAATDPDAEVRAAAASGAHTLWVMSRRPRHAGGFSLLCPGCGYFYLHQPGRALGYLGVTAGLIGGALALAAGGSTLSQDQAPRMTPTTTPLAVPALIAAQNVWFYGVFASYRDARLARGDLGYRYPISHEGLADLLSAPVRPRVLARPWFWAGLPVAVAAAVGFSALVSPRDLGRGVRSLSDGQGVWFLGRHHGTAAGVGLAEAYWTSLFLPVGVGEEALFRGTLQPGLTESFGLLPGWALTSAIFGGVHLFNFVGQDQGGLALAVRAVPFLTVVGSYLGATAIKTGFQLETSVAIHFWYDFLLGTIGFVADPDHQPFALRFGLPF
jgi:membrane protease YdiL (CAAX protease family)